MCPEFGKCSYCTLDQTNMSLFRDHTYIYPSPYVSSHQCVPLLLSPYRCPCTDVSSYHCVYAYNYVIVRIKLQALVTTSFLRPLPYLVTPQGPENCQLMSSFFVGAQTVVSLLQTTQMKQGVSFIAANKVYTSTNKTTIV